jgi:hypothetical protein
VTRPKNIFWDSCCFIRLVTRNPTELLGDMEHYIQDSRQGIVMIHYSTVAYTEMRPRYFVGSRYGTIEEFFAHWGSAFHPFDPNPNILIAAGRLRDAEPVNPFPKAVEPTNRRVGAADAIQLATCLFLRNIGNDDIVFHTFDEGKGSTSHEGKPLPIIGFERWFPEGQRTQLVTDVCNLPRCKPEHPTPDLVTEVVR